ncbi:class I SAM-dependent methyltransferase [Microbacteriaceae bacterium 4G12]
MTTVHPSDLHLVTEWADGIDGPVLDAGCGPGHWTAHLAERGVHARGIDQVAGFIGHARHAHPGVAYDTGDLAALPDVSASIGGVLAWYSLIHHEPTELRAALAEFARVLRPGGGMLIGFFSGSALERFDHAVVSAFRWPVEALSEELHGAGFETIEAHTRTGQGYRPHGAIVARRLATL